MKNLTITFMIILLGIQIPAFGQNDDPIIRGEILVDGMFKNYFGNKYISPQKDKKISSFSDHQYDHFTLQPTWGFELGLLLKIMINRHWAVEPGVGLSMRTTALSRSIEMTKKHGYFAPESYGFQDIRNVTKYHYTFYNLNLSLMLSYIIYHVHLSAGIMVPFEKYSTAKYSYLVKKNSGADSWEESKKKVKGNLKPGWIFYFPIRLSYDIQINPSFSIRPFIGIQFGAERIVEFKNYYLKAGIIFDIGKRWK